MTIPAQQVRRLEQRLAALEAATGITKPFPVGAIFLSVSSTNPATLLGYGTWTAWGTGRMPVGVDTGDVDFATVELTGGSKDTAAIAAATGVKIVQAGAGSAPSDSTHQHPLLPYITCYMWKRTA